MPKPLSGIDYLLDPAPQAAGPVCVVAGDEAYLKREVLRGLRETLCGDGDAEFSWQTFVGKEAEWRDVADSLASLSLFGGGGQRATLVEEADTFVTRCRTQLEDFVDRPPAGAVLVLDVKSWPGNTRLAKAVANTGLTIKTTVPDRGAELGAFKRSLTRWLAKRAASHDAKLPDAAVAVLLDLLPMSVGLLDQEVAKLSLIATSEAGAGGTISPDLVRKHVGGWRAQKTWDMIDAMADGDAASALDQLDRLLRAGEQPIGLLAQMSSTLRRFTAACRLVELAESRGQKPQLRGALERAGAPKFKTADAERQLKRIGRKRASKLNDWLLDADLALKGHNSTPARARTELERLVVRLSAAAR
ncbi:MAG: DNA polymerase III subunit delta [Planctomycetota bacterium]